MSLKMHRMLINGRLVDGSSGGYFDVINPSTGHVFAQAPRATKEQVIAAIEHAREGFKVWSKMNLSKRQSLLSCAADVLESHRSELELLLSTEQGKPLSGSRSETSTAIAMFREAAKVIVPIRKVKESDSHVLEVRHKPVGVAVGITPWNYPLSLRCGKISKALAYGNSVILKPSPFTPLTSLMVGELLGEIFPPGVINVVAGNDVPGSNVSVGQLLVESPNINLVSFTGSVATGKRIMAACAANMTRVMLELGGNDPAIVLADADIPFVARSVCTMGMANCGQICCAVKRVYVHASVFDSFVEEISKVAKSFKVGDGVKERDVFMGPLNNRAQLDRVKELLKDAISHGAKVHTGGSVPSHTDPEGYFFEPTIVTGVAEGVRLVDEEQFGPILPIMSYSTEEEVIRRANGSVFGLGASVWGKDKVALNRIADQLEAGIVWTNEHAVLREGAPFGGVKQSGFRREGDFGPSDLDAYTEIQTVKAARL